MKLTYLGITICLFLSTTIPSVLAEMDHFLAPGPNSRFQTGDTIPFLIEDMPDEDDQNVNANLHKADGSFIKTIKTWSIQSIEEGGDEFPFSWQVDVTETGSYYVEIVAGGSREDMIQSYPFQIQGETESGDASASTPVDNSSSSDVAPQSIQNEEVQEEQEEPEEQEGSATKTLSLHNQQSKVAHISSHNDINTVSESSLSPAEEAEPQQIPQNGHQSSSELATPASVQKSEPLMPEPGASASMKELAAADDIAVEEEKKWLAQQQKGSNRKPTSSPSHDKEKAPSAKQSKAQQKKQKTKSDHHAKSATKSTKNKDISKVAAIKAADKIATSIINNKDLKAQIQAKTKQTAAKVKEDVKKSTDQEKERQKLTLAQQEALDDQAIRAEMAQIKSYGSQGSKVKSASKEKREAYRKVMRNRARFAKQGLQ